MVRSPPALVESSRPAVTDGSDDVVCAAGAATIVACAAAVGVVVVEVVNGVVAVVVVETAPAVGSNRGTEIVVVGDVVVEPGPATPAWSASVDRRADDDI